MKTDFKIVPKDLVRCENKRWTQKHGIRVTVRTGQEYKWFMELDSLLFNNAYCEILQYMLFRYGTKIRRFSCSVSNGRQNYDLFFTKMFTQTVLEYSTSAISGKLNQFGTTTNAILMPTSTCRCAENIVSSACLFGWLNIHNKVGVIHV